MHSFLMRFQSALRGEIKCALLVQTYSVPLMLTGVISAPLPSADKSGKNITALRKVFGFPLSASGWSKTSEIDNCLVLSHFG